MAVSRCKIFCKMALFICIIISSSSALPLFDRLNPHFAVSLCAAHILQKQGVQQRIGVPQFSEVMNQQLTMKRRYRNDGDYSHRRRKSARLGMYNNIATELVLDDEILGQHRNRTLPDIDSGLGFTIREAKYSDLPDVSRIIVEAFYPIKPLFNHYHMIKELARIQNNFPYDDTKHSMLVAVSNADNKTVVAFVDIDAREPKTKLPMNPPRPYLSDLAVDIYWRRKGIASALIVACEMIVEGWGENYLNLRVEAANEPALTMYARLGYSFVEHHWFGKKDTTMLLRRCLSSDDRYAKGSALSSKSSIITK
mmetsp:Transcript_21762/g.33267  ORF Transcript_21762/g.33267 Transcript_21762/m.33267 type:complete len:310 (-) Transcript_21762:94-1023(-)